MRPAFSSIAVITAALGMLVITVTRAVTFAVSPSVVGDPLHCDLARYKAVSGLSATLEPDLLMITWTGSAGGELRVTYAIETGQPVIRVFEGSLRFTASTGARTCSEWTPSRARRNPGSRTSTKPA
jgi:hypothetical protein